MFGREPAIVVAALVAIVQGILIFTTGDPSVDASAWGLWLTPVVTLLGGWLTRRKVVPAKRVSDAGLDPVTLSGRKRP